MADVNDPNSIPDSPTSRSSNGLGIAGFVLALVGAVLSWVPFLGIALCVIGVIFSAIGFNNVKKHNAPYRGLSLSGLIVGIVALVLSIVLTIIILVEIDDEIDCYDHYLDYLDAPLGSDAESEAYERWIECR